MKKFLMKTVAIIILSAISLTSVYCLMPILTSDTMNFDSTPFLVLEKAGINSGKPSVILGDSVCGQLWPRKNDSPNISHLSNNQATTAAGSYLLLKRYLEHNPQTKDVYYAVKPQTLGNDMDLYATYQYFVIPFFNSENVKFIDEETKQDIYRKFGRFFAESTYAKYILSHNNFFMSRYLDYVWHKSGLVRDNISDEFIQKRRLARCSVIYLKKMNELCRQHSAKFHVLPLPLRYENDRDGWDKFVDDVKRNGLEDILGSFIDDIDYYPESWFSDRIHFTKDVISSHSDDIRAAVMK